MHLSFFPITLVQRSICPFVRSNAFHILINKVSLIPAAIRPSEVSLPMLVSVGEPARVFASIRKLLSALSMEESIFKVTLINISAIRVEFPMPVLLVVLPVSRIDTCISVDFAAKTMDTIFNPVAFVEGAVLKD